MNASLELERLSVKKAVTGVRLDLNLKVHASPPAREGVPHGFIGRASLEAASGIQFLGELHPDGVIYLLNGGHSGRFSAGCPVSTEGLERIEDAREGRAFKLLIDYEFFAISDGQAIGSGQTSLPVSTEQWTSVLQIAEIMEHFVLLIPKPSPHADEGSREAWEDWLRARHAIDGGRWRDAVAECRHALEHLGLPPPPKDPRTRDKTQRWHGLAAELLKLTSAAHHSDPVTREMTWSRDDAIGAVAVLGGLIRATCSDSSGK